MSFALTSPAFDAGAALPERHTCRGEGLLPPLVWSDPPQGCRSFALILEDPGAPGGMFRHFGAYNLPTALRDLPEGRGELAAPAQPVLHDFGAPGLFSPCPPPGSGTHHYRFRLFALSDTLSFERPPTCQGLIAMMQGALLAEAGLAATCEG